MSLRYNQVQCFTMKKFIEFQAQIGKLKHLKRTGWVVRQVPHPETVAAHSWRMAFMAICKAPAIKRMGADLDYVIRLCLLHDVGEAVVGDIIPPAHQTGAQKISAAMKKRIEKEAICALAKTYDFPQLKSAFYEYEAQKTPEARIVRNLDKVDMLLQAYEYSVAYPALDRLGEFLRYNEKDVTLPLFEADVREIKARQLDQKKHKNTFIEASLRAGRVKHQPYNPTKAAIPDYDTVAAHLFRSALIAICLDAPAALIRAIIVADKRRTEPVLETLENLLQAYEYTQLYPDNKELITYLQTTMEQITCYKK